MPQVGGRSIKLEEIAKRRSQENKLADFVVQVDETRVLDFNSPAMKRHYAKIDLENVIQLKELIGVPDSVAVASTIEAITRDTALERNVLARTIDPSIFSNAQVREIEKTEARTVAHEAAEKFIFGKSSEVHMHEALVNAYLKERSAAIFVGFFNDITVQRNATLRVARNTFAIYANRIRLFGTGRIICDGPTTFDCQSFRGNLSSDPSPIGDVLTGNLPPQDF